MIEIAKIATNLECREHGIWFRKNQSHISYPEDGHSRCLAIEDASFWFKHRNKCIIEVMHRFPPAGAVFDVGAGNGYVSSAIKNAGLPTVVIEPGLQGAMNAHRKGLNPVICSTLEDAGFNPHLIPAVGLFDILEHIEDDIGFLTTTKTLLVPNGRLYITVPAYNFLRSVEDNYAGHYRRYTLKDLTKKLESTGFEIEFKTYIFGVLPFPMFFFRTIPSKLGLRKVSKFGRNRAEHVQPDSWLGRLVNLILYIELIALRNNITIPFGGSCLAIARSSNFKTKYDVNSQHEAFADNPQSNNM